ncbi:MAG: hypothetical protein ACRDO1_00680 [Nocardioidaceae bacterium]
MSRVDDFDAFYHGTRASLLHQTYALTGNVDGAASAVEHGFAHAWSHWSKVTHLDDPVAWVRAEAWRVAGSQLPRRRRLHYRRPRSQGAVPADAYADRLQDLSINQRRVAVLHHLAGLPDDQLAREAGVTTTAAANTLIRAEAAWDDSAAGADQPTPGPTLEQALRDIETDAARITLMRASAVRRAGDKRLRQHTVLGVAAAAALIVGGGSLITQQSPPTTAASVTDDTPAGAKPAPKAEPTAARTLGTSDLLALRDLRSLSPQHTQWSTAMTTSGPLNKDGAYTLCQRRTLADPDAKQVLIRQFEAVGAPDTNALQVIEQSTSAKHASRAYAEMRSWFATCTQESIQLLQVQTVGGLGDQATVVSLREGGKRAKNITVGVARTGKLTSAVVATTTGKKPISEARVVKRLAMTVSTVCKVGEGSCATAKPTLRPVPVPALQSNPGFLAPLDLPQIKGVASPWAATKPKSAGKNPSSTPCDRATFAKSSKARARIFVIPKAKFVPDGFGLSETVGTFGSSNTAARFVRKVEDTVADCADREINATVSDATTITSGRTKARVWRFQFELSEGRTATYRVALVRRGKHIAQVNLSPSGSYDMTPQRFRALVIRAGERLSTIPS